MGEEKLTFRDQAIQLLELYASAEEQRKYQENVPFVPVPIELVCMWFDDFWTPGEEPPPAAYIAQWRASIEKFYQCFTAAELEALKNFHQYFDARVNRLPERDLEELLDTPAWQEVMSKARETLQVFKKT